MDDVAGRAGLLRGLAALAPALGAVPERAQRPVRVQGGAGDGQLVHPQTRPRAQADKVLTGRADVPEAGVADPAHGRELLRGGPLVVACVRTTPHADLAAAPRLAGEPFDQVMTVFVFVYDRFKLTLRVAAPAHIHQGEDISIL